jgi:uncharacterized surface protein with fasciclin (FAS1) repeats
MLVSCFFSLTLAALATAQSLQQVLTQNAQTLSTLNCKPSWPSPSTTLPPDHPLTSYPALLQANPQLTQTLSTARGITILAPNNAAFEKLLAENPSAAQMARDPTLVTALLSYHVLAGTFTAKSFSATPQFAPTLLARSPFANVTGGQKVELVLVPSARGGSTGNAAVLSGFRRQSIVAATDIPFTGGIIHVVDTVLTIPLKPSQTALDAGLTSLAGALTQANLVGTLDSTKDITVFAPSNQAFQAIGSAVSTLNAQQLGGILSYHVVSGSVLFSTLLVAANGQPMSIRTLNGQTITVRRQGNEVFVNSARVVTPNVITGNGVVHVIDK